MILTWGLLGPGKGIERVIDAMASLKDLPGQPRYLIAGRTHPKVLAAEGEAYREALVEQARRLGVAASVSFDPVYRSPADVIALVQSAAVVVLPYDSKDQVTSGVLVDSVASGRPIVATAFPHAVEMLGSGAGTVVDHDDPDAMVECTAPIADGSSRRGIHGRGVSGTGPDDGLADRRQYLCGPGPTAARRTVGTDVTGTSLTPSFAHLLRMTDHQATFEHALLTEPRREHGYCTDDMARVLVVTTREPESSGPVNGLAGKALQFLNDAQSYNGACRNRMGQAGRWLDRTYDG